jgi:hypothetical protein
VRSLILKGPRDEIPTSRSESAEISRLRVASDPDRLRGQLADERPECFRSNGPRTKGAMPQFCVWIFAPGTRKIGDNLKLVEPAALFFGSVRLSADGKSYAFSFQRDLATLYLVKDVK